MLIHSYRDVISEFNLTLNGHVVFPIDTGIQTDMLDELRSQGWCFIYWKDVESNDLMNNLRNFFAEPVSVKDQYSNNGLGYSAVGHKEGVRVLTGSRFETGIANDKDLILFSDIPKFPDSLQHALLKLCQVLDQKSIH